MQAERANSKLSTDSEMLVAKSGDQIAHLPQQITYDPYTSNGKPR